MAQIGVPQRVGWVSQKLLLRVHDDLWLAVVLDSLTSVSILLSHLSWLLVVGMLI